MAESRYETAERVMRELGGICHDGELHAYIAAYLDTPAEQKQAAELFDMARRALEIVNRLGVFIHEYHV